MKDLMDAIYDAYDGDAALKAALTGGMFLSRAPAGTSFPYCRYDLISNAPSHLASQAVLEDALIQFMLFDDDKAASDICDAYAALIALYDWYTVTANSKVHIFRRIGNRVFWFEDVWHYEAEYRVLVHAA